MLAQRAAQQSLRRVVFQQHALRFATPAAIATGNVITVQKRLTAAQAVSQEAATKDILTQQRKHRPVAPHLAIYQAQITWYLSMLNRLTGIAMSGPFYLFGAAYLIAPYVGLHLESAVIAASFASWPVALKFLTKAIVAFPFTFHSFNGMRHLVWDTASMIRNQQVNRSGWAVVGLSVVSAITLALL